MYGTNKIYEVSFLQIGNKFLFLIILSFFNIFYLPTIISTMSIQYISLLSLIIVLTFLLKPKFKQIRINIVRLFQENKTYGFPVYIGTIASVASSKLGGIFIGFYIDTLHVGFFSLALAITSPLILVASSAGNAFYKEFANSDRIPKKATIITILSSLIVLVLFYFLIDKAIHLLYSKDFNAVIHLSYFLAIGSVLQGLGDYFNRFIGAHGLGRYNRNTAIFVGTFNIIGYIFLTKYFGINGAVFTSIFSSTLYLSIMLYFYEKYKGTSKN